MNEKRMLEAINENLGRVRAGIQASELEIDYVLSVLLSPYTQSSICNLSIFSDLVRKSKTENLLFYDFSQEEAFEIFEAFRYCVRYAINKNDTKLQYTLEEFEKYNFVTRSLHKKYPKFKPRKIIKEKSNKKINLTFLHYLYVIPLLPPFILWCAISEVIVDYAVAFGTVLAYQVQKYNVIGNIILFPLTIIFVVIFGFFSGTYVVLLHIFARIAGLITLDYLNNPKEVLIGTAVFIR